MADRVKCPDCGEVLDARGLNSHARQVHGKRDATKEDFEIMENASKPVVEANSTEEVMREIESGRTGDLVGVSENAIIFRNEIIVTDPEIKERVADALVDQMGGRF